MGSLQCSHTFAFAAEMKNYVKMAADRLVVSDLLCYLVYKFGKMPLKELKAVLLDFYEADAIAEARLLLLKDVEAFKADLKLPYMPAARRNDTTGELNDIVTILSTVDEQKLYGRLPKYVSQGPDNMPSIHMGEGDLNCLLSLIRKLAEKVDGMGAEMGAIMKEVRDLQVQRPVTSLAEARTPLRDKQQVEQRPSVNQTVAVSCQPPLQSSLQPHQAYGYMPGQLSALDSDRLLGSCLAPGTAWAAAATSSPIQTSNRFTPLQAIDGSHGAEDDDERNPFINARSRRAAKRQRQTSSVNQQQQQPSQQMQSGSSQQQRRRRAGRLLTGTSNSSATTHRIVAAKTFVKKAIFCIDNVSTSVDIDGLKQFVESLSVAVISCFATNPRRRRGESLPIKDRKAFRLCIADSDRDRLLNADLWPDSVTISDWFRGKPRSSSVQQQRQQLLQSPGNLVEATATTVSLMSATDITPVAAEADNENVAADSDSDVVTVDDNTVIVMDYTETTIKACGSIDGATTAVV